jgi:hypothetical protein
MRDWSERPGNWERDEFGLPIKPKVERARDRVLREMETRGVAIINLSAIYRTLQERFGGGPDGARRARQCFDGFASKKPRYSKGQHGARDQKKNDRLLQLYDFWAGEGTTRLEIAEVMYAKFGDELGASAEAIDKQLQRLLADRKVQAQDAEAFLEQIADELVGLSQDRSS